MATAARKKGKRGGKRPGAGRPPKGPISSEAHRERPPIDPRHPIHVAIRARAGANLRGRDGWLAVRHGLELARRRIDFRICHVSVQPAHIHLIVEADSANGLARGMQGFQIACARRFNTLTGGRGRVFEDRYHPEPLVTLRQVRDALAFVLNHWRRAPDDATARHRAFDPFASARAFDGWDGAPERSELEIVPVVMPTTWALTIGWRRYGLIPPHERPAPIAPKG
ncbi:MAG: hypothetical protein K8W52_41290 [Deltaproteobacteria bacterium]|nr:hypothetical protein [Deltaproteobacteria bacterium]